MEGKKSVTLMSHHEEKTSQVSIATKPCVFFIHLFSPASVSLRQEETGSDINENSNIYRSHCSFSAQSDEMEMLNPALT